MSAQSLATVAQQAIVPLADLERMAMAIAKSGLFGVKEPAQAIALCLVAQAEGLHPAIAARDYNVIQGRPAKSAEAMLRSFLSAGGRVTWHTLDDSTADATFSHLQGGEWRCIWTIDRARNAGLAVKDMWKKYPRQMLRARCISEGVRTIYPGATSGMCTPEEANTRRGCVTHRQQLPVEAPPDREPEPPIGNKSKAHIELSNKIKELQLEREYVKGIAQRKFTRHQADGFHLYHLSVGEQSWLMDKLPSIALHKLREHIGNVTDTAELALIGRTPPAWMSEDDKAALLLEIDERMSALAVPPDRKEDGPTE